MKISPRNAHANHVNRRPFHLGMTILELTVVILVMLTLVSILFIAANAWKRGSDRAVCIMNIQNVQKGIRSYTNLHNLNPNTNIPGLKNFIIGDGRFVSTTPICLSHGVYTYGEDTVPPIGTLYMQCSRSVSDGHEPADFGDW